MEMGLLDEVLNFKKEAGYNRPVRVPPSQKNLEKTQPSTPRTPLALSNVSIFGSLKKGTAASTIPKTTPISTNVNDVKKKIGTTKGKLLEKPKEKRNWFRVSPRKDPDIKASSTSVNVVGGNNHKSVVLDGAKKKPRGVFLDSNITYRRGQNTKLDGQNIDNLSRTSSITNLDADTKASKGAKPKKSASRDRLDKIGEHRKNDKKSPPKNNNKLETEDIPYPSIELTQEEEFLELKRQLQEMAQEKTNLALQLGEQKGQLQSLQKEIMKLKAYQDESNKELEHLTEENTALRNRLRDVAHSPLSDNEKQQLLFESHRQHSSAPASIATNLLDEGTGGDNTTCTTPDWDKHSSSNVSEVSVACLQDKINQMQETHYSTNEELQATLQELTDLQRQLTELQQENERLTDEKNLMFDSLCRQTERLNDSRSEVESLKQLLYQEKDDASQFESAVEREQKLVALLKSAQEERENLLVKLEQLNNDLQDARSALLEKDDRIGQLSERVKTLEYTLDAKHAEHKLLDQDLAQARDQCSGKQIEINRLNDLLENARTKIIELEQDRALSDKSELDELLDNARKEKDTLESEVAHLKKQLALSKNEIEKLKEQVSILQEECKVTRNNARTTQSDLEYKCEKLMKEKIDLNGQIQEFQEALNELQVQSQCQLEDKRQLSAVLSETQRNLSEAERKNLSLENEVDELKKLRAEENAEWEKFQSDLLTSVRVANDFKTEAQQQLQRMILENKSFRDRERQLQAEIEKLKEPIWPNKETPTAVSFTNSEPSNMDLLLKRPKQKGITKKQSGTYESDDRSRKKESTLEAKTDKSQRKKVEFATVPKDDSHKNKTLSIKNDPQIIKRTNRSLLAQKRFKSVSVEEEHLLDSLKRRYQEIEKLPQNKRSEMDHSIVRLKLIYDDENLKYKPIASKPKDQLAISKPLLESVFHNPKLKSIALDPGIKSTDNMENSLGRTSMQDKQDPIEEPRPLSKPLSIDDVSQLDGIRKKPLMTRSYSYGDFLDYSDVAAPEVPLYRSVITEDLTRAPSLVLRRSSTILPSDSASNFDNSIDQDVQLRKESIKVSFTNLDKIVAAIPPGTPENQLSKEQKFAVRLKKALDSVERKTSLKRVRRSRKPKVSLPTKESVWKNDKLRKILQNKDFLDVPRKKRGSHRGRNTSRSRGSQRLTRSYEDIVFSFDKIPLDHQTPTTIKQNSKTSSSTSSSTTSSTLSNAEFDLDTVTFRPCSIKTYAQVTGIEDSDYIEFYPEGPVKLKTGVESEQLINKDIKRSYEVDSDEVYSEARPLEVSNVVQGKSKATKHFGSQDDLFYNETLDKYSRKLKNEVDILEESINQSNLLYAEAINFSNTSFSTFKSPSSSPGNYKDSNVDAKIIEVQKTETDPTIELTAIKESRQSLARYKSINAKFEELHKLIHEDDDVPLRRLRSVSSYGTSTSSIEDCPGEEDKLPVTYQNSTSDSIPMTSSLRTSEEYVQQSIGGTSENTNKDFGTEVLDSSNSTSVNPSGAIEQENSERKACHAKTDLETGEAVKGICPSQIRQHKRHSNPKTEQEYHYTNILRENKYGVTTPLSLRISYRDCVNEIKTKAEKVTEDRNLDSINSDDDGLHNEMKINVEREAPQNDTNFLQTRIDSEMEEIFEKYLKMPISKVLSQNEVHKELDDVNLKSTTGSIIAEEYDNSTVNVKASAAVETQFRLSKDTAESAKDYQVPEERFVERNSEETGNTVSGEPISSAKTLEFNDNDRQIVDDNIITNINHYDKSTDDMELQQIQKLEDLNIKEDDEEDPVRDLTPIQFEDDSRPNITAREIRKDLLQTRISAISDTHSDQSSTIYQKPYGVFKISANSEASNFAAQIFSDIPKPNENTIESSHSTLQDQSAVVNQTSAGPSAVARTAADQDAVRGFNEDTCSNSTRYDDNIKLTETTVGKVDTEIPLKEAGISVSNRRPETSYSSVKEVLESGSLKGVNSPIFADILKPLQTSVGKPRPAMRTAQKISQEYPSKYHNEVSNEDLLIQQLLSPSPRKERSKRPNRKADIKIAPQASNFESVVKLTDTAVGNQDTTVALEEPIKSLSDHKIESCNSVKEFLESVSLEAVSSRTLADKSTSKPSEPNSNDEVENCSQASTFESDTIANLDFTLTLEESDHRIETDKELLESVSLDGVSSPRVTDKSSSKPSEPNRNDDTQSGYEASKFESDLELTDTAVGILDTTIALEKSSKSVSDHRIETFDSSVKEFLGSESLDVVNNRTIADKSASKSLEPYRNDDVGIDSQAITFESNVELTDTSIGRPEIPEFSVKGTTESENLDGVDFQKLANESTIRFVELSQIAVSNGSPTNNTIQQTSQEYQSKYHSEVSDEYLLTQQPLFSPSHKQERGKSPNGNFDDTEYGLKLIDSKLGNQKIPDESSRKSLEPLQTVVSKPTLSTPQDISQKYQSKYHDDVSDEDLLIQQLLLSPIHRIERSKQPDGKLHTENVPKDKFVNESAITYTVTPSNSKIRSNFTENTPFQKKDEPESNLDEFIRRKRNILPVPLKPADDTNKPTSARKSQEFLIEDTRSKRISFPTFDRKLLSTTRKVKSFAQHFEKLSADQKKTPPLSKQTRNVPSRYQKEAPIQKIERKPQPLPRKVNQATKDTTTDTDDSVKIDRTMTDYYENFSDKNVSQYLNMSDNINLIEDDLEDAPKIISEQYKEEIINEVLKSDNKSNREVEINSSDLRAGGSSASQEQSNRMMRAGFSPSSIAVAGKFESLNLTDSSVINSVEEGDDTDSDLNLFSMDSVNLEDSYLNLFKSPEEMVYENLTRKQNLRGFINVVCLEEQSDTESDDSIGRYEKIGTILEGGSKPRIIDFVPLDDNDTKNVFDKASVNLDPNKTLSAQACSSKSVDGTTVVPNSVEVPNSKTAPDTTSALGTIGMPSITKMTKLDKETDDLKNPNTNPESFKVAKSFFERLELNNANNNNSIDVEGIKNPVPD